MDTAEEIFYHIACRNAVSVGYVKAQIENTAVIGMKSADPNIRYFWNQVPRKGATPTAGEIVTHLAYIAKKISES